MVEKFNNKVVFLYDTQTDSFLIKLCSNNEVVRQIDKLCSGMLSLNSLNIHCDYYNSDVKFSTDDVTIGPYSFGEDGDLFVTYVDGEVATGTTMSGSGESVTYSLNEEIVKDNKLMNSLFGM